MATSPIGPNLSTTIFEHVYPVGSIYITESELNPNAILPGGESSTWEKLEDRVLIGAGATYSLGSQGGEATHTLTVNELPSHNHTTSSSGNHNHGTGWGENSGTANAPHGLYSSGNNKVGCADTDWDNNEWATTTNGAHTHTVGYSGGGQPHNNLPPYRAVNMWKRVG